MCLLRTVFWHHIFFDLPGDFAFFSRTPFKPSLLLSSLFLLFLFSSTTSRFLLYLRCRYLHFVRVSYAFLYRAFALISALFFCFFFHNPGRFLPPFLFAIRSSPTRVGCFFFPSFICFRCRVAAFMNLSSISTVSGFLLVIYYAFSLSARVLFSVHHSFPCSRTRFPMWVGA